MKEILLCLGAYLLGCFATGHYLVRWRRGVDIRTVGSKTTGAFNVARLMQTPGFVITVLGDLLKGVLAVALARYFQVDKLTLLFVMIAVVVGHDFPVQLDWRGGNGLATGTGALAMFDPPLALALTILFVISLPLLALLKAVFKLPIKYYTPSQVTVLAMPVMALMLEREWWVALGLAFLVAIIMWTIRNNMKHLAQAV